MHILFSVFFTLLHSQNLMRTCTKEPTWMANESVCTLRGSSLLLGILARLANHSEILLFFSTVLLEEESLHPFY